MKKHLKSILLMTVGSFISALALDMFLFPLHISPGGVSSMAAMLAMATPITTGMYIIIINIPLFLMSLRLNRTFFFKSLYGMILSSVFVDLLSGVDSSILGLGDDLVIASVFGGALLGTGYGLVHMVGGSSGGTDIAGCLLRQKVPNIRLGKAILIFDIIIITIQSLVFGNIKLSLYAVVTLYIQSKIIDYFVEGVNFAKIAFIISNRGDEISKRILKETGRGVTGIAAKGMYTQNDRTMLMCTMHKGDLPRIKKIVKEVDMEAFFILSDTREVIGEGFNN